MRKLTLLFLTLLAPLAAAEIKLPQVSPSIRVEHAVGVSRLEVRYHRPAVKGRAIWGELVPYGKVWRLGANNATTLTLSHPAKVNGHDVPAGQYALFAIPAADRWTLILNKKAEQWGAYFHDAKEDLLRFDVKPQAAEHAEWFSIDVTPASDRVLEAAIRWEKIRVPFTIEFDTPGIVWKNIESELASPAATWESWHNAARYAWQNGQRLNDALTWIDKANAMKESFWNYELKALILRKLGRTEEARPLMAKAKELAAGKAPKEYLEGIDREVASWR
ncbi:MAG TPA: DUF2911 domain-containing protein [Thermoanaerobaculia bacterium]|jgi:tetratricopeptide (TPR) repeat protein